MKKGPERVPDSPLVLLVAFGLLLVAIAGPNLLLAGSAEDNIATSLANAFLGYLLYWIVLLLAGFRRRAVPTIASIMACGSILTIAMIIVVVVLTPLGGPVFASLPASLILFWSVPVKGHIIARALDRHWYVGIAIALCIFIIQYVAYQAMSAPPVQS